MERGEYCTVRIVARREVKEWTDGGLSNNFAVWKEQGYLTISPQFHHPSSLSSFRV